MKKICDMKDLRAELAGTEWGSHARAAKILGCTPQTLSNWIALKVVPPTAAFRVNDLCLSKNIELCPELLGLKKNDCGCEAA